MHGFLEGLQMVMTMPTLLAIFLGSVGGVIIGALPGLSSTLGVALLVPFTFGLQPAPAMGLLGGMYCSSIYGGSITAILINTPGTGAAAATVLDGYPMTQKGQAGKAMHTAILASFFGGVFGTFALLFIAPLLSKIALKFGPPETFMLSVFGLTIIASVSSKSLTKGVLSGLIGLLFSTVGFDMMTGYPRFAFGNIHLYEGIALVVALVGFFSIPEAFTLIRNPEKSKERTKVVIDKDSIDDRLTKQEIISLIPTFIRGSIIGTIIGIVPGVGTPVACFVAYNEEKRFSKHPEKFGTGIIEGVAAPESANNAVEGGSFVPLLTLGIPGSSQTAVYVGAMLILGIKPGPELFGAQAPTAYMIILGLFVANLMILGIGLGGLRFFVKIIKLPDAIMVPIILTFAIIGSYAINASIFDVGLMLFLGIIGYLMRLNDMPLAPLVLSLILGPIGESAFLQTLSITHGQPWLIFARPICLILFSITVLSLVFSFRKTRITE